MNQMNSDGTDADMPIVFVNGAFEWLRDMFYAGVQFCGVLILGAVGIAGAAYGLMRAGWL